MGKDIKREVDFVLAPKLASFGFTKRKLRYVRDCDGGHGWVSVAKTPYPKPRVLLVDLKTGIWLEAIEELRHELLRSKSVPGETTIVEDVGFLAAGDKATAWKFSYDASQEEIEAGAESMATTIEDYAIPFIDSHSDPAALVTAMMKESFPGFSQQRIRMTLGFHLLGDEEKALALLDDTVAQLADTKGPAAEEVRSFARAYRETFG